ncbi:MAG: hypothetical protein IPJ77_15825 [Planctomycetes bacterium]|nr:hypothetical protein [Planctomycetota bacterium]
MAKRRDEPRASRWLLQAVALALLGLAPLVATREPVALVAWFALVAPGAGVLAGAARLPAWPWAPVVPALWMAALALATADGARVVPTPAFAAGVWSGLYLAGFGAGRIAGPSGPRLAAAVTLALAALVGVPIGLGLCDAPLPPEWTARVMRLSPLTWTLEAASVDWLRHAAFYERAHAFDLGPELIGRPRPALAGGLALVLGCLAAWVGIRVSRAGSTDPAPARS